MLRTSTNGWTGGQYSVYRSLLGACLFIYCAALTGWGPDLVSRQGSFLNALGVWDARAVVTSLLLAGMALSALLAIGLYDRPAALLLWGVFACLSGPNPPMAGPSLPYAGWVLLAHACLPAAPYGSWAARGRPDPGSTWRLPQPVYRAAWILMALGYTYDGYVKMADAFWTDASVLARDSLYASDALLGRMDIPLSVLRFLICGLAGFELGFAPLALVRRIRPWTWTLMLALRVGSLSVFGATDSTLGMVALHVFTFNPAWIRSRGAGAVDTIFYDGHCGLCHRAVRFVLAEDPTGSRFRFAPLGGDLFQALVPADRRAGLPDSLVVRTAGGILLTRSAAVLYAMESLGGIWRVVGRVARLIPRSLRDRAYGRVASVRHRLFSRPADVCPVVSPHLQPRFHADAASTGPEAHGRDR